MQNEMKKFKTAFVEEHNENSDVNKMWKCIKEEFKRIMDSFVPTKLTTRNFQQPWFNCETKKLIRKKKRWFKKMKSSNCDRVREKYMKIKKECQQVCRAAHSNHMKTMFDDDKHNKKLWTYIKSKNQEQTGIPDLKHNEKTIKDPKEKANILNSQFASVFSDPIPEISLNVQDSETNTTMDDL